MLYNLNKLLIGYKAKFFLFYLLFLVHTKLSQSKVVNAPKFTISETPKHIVLKVSCILIHQICLKIHEYTMSL